MPALIFLVIATAGGNLFGFLSQLAYNSGILSIFAFVNYKVILLSVTKVGNKVERCKHFPLKVICPQARGKTRGKEGWRSSP